jgi:dipeptidyl aminopeptidase/acylaminoacyl peptidase
MAEPKIEHYGSWVSPIKSSDLSSGTLRLGQTQYDNGNLYWIEGRPTDGGKQTLVRRDEKGIIEDVSPRGFNVRTLVNEYGGAPYLVRNGKIFCSNYSDQVIYQINPDAQTPADGRRIPLTPEGEYHFADFEYDSKRNRLIFVCEDHSDPTKQPVTTINVVMAVAPGEKSTRQRMEILVSGNDFYSNPRLSPDGKLFAWISWDHPNMPWDGTALWMAEVNEDGSLSKRRKIAGADDESVMQPVWSAAGDLLFISDRLGWWNIYALPNPTKNLNPVALLEKNSDFATPQWVFGLSNYCFTGERTLIASFFENGKWQLAVLQLDALSKTKKVSFIPSELTEISYLTTNGSNVGMIAGSPIQQTAVVDLDLGDLSFKIIKASNPDPVDLRYTSVARAVEFPSERNLIANAYFYPPHNEDFVAPDGELPPLLLTVHGGPTAAASNALDFEIQYWTSRGFAVMDVNYAGSSNYGRQYRQRLTLNWGLVDLEDCQNAARYAARQGWVDPKRMAITGGSAGGYTALCALTFSDVFAAGSSHYGVSNLETLVQDTHKFESRYLDRIVGPYPAYKQVYQNRSPINNVDKLSRPIIFFQGLEDKVVPPSQTETMVAAMRKRKIPFCYLSYEGEGHGFRRAENIRRTIDAEFLFYSKMFGFAPAETLEAIEIENFQQ